MYFKVAVTSALLAFCQAGLIEGGHGQAVSSQSIFRHDEPSQQLQQQHFSPVLEHGEQILQNYGPILQHAAPVIEKAASLHHVGPAPIHHGHHVVIGHHDHFGHDDHFGHHDYFGHHDHFGHHHHFDHHERVGHHDHDGHHAPAKYEFSYSVHDTRTGDHKNQHESRNGDVVKGEYSLLQPDGSVRKVKYSADDHHGFNAFVHNFVPHTAHAASLSPAPFAHTAPVVHAGPVVQGGPVVHAVPVVHTDPLVQAGALVHAAPAHYITAHN